MSMDQVIEQFRPLFRSELPDRIGRIHAGLEGQRTRYDADPLQAAFREAHSLAGMAAYMDAPEVTAAAERLSVLVRELLVDTRETRKPLGEAWRIYDRLRTAAAAYLGVDSVGPDRPRSDDRASDDG